MHAVKGCYPRKLANLAYMIAARTGPLGNSDDIYLLRDQAGTVLAGNWPPIAPFAGWRELEIRVPAAGRGMGRRETILGLGIRITDGFLMVGASLRRIGEVQRLLFQTLNWTLGLTLVLALVGGAVIGRGAMRRVEAINRTTHDIIRGNLSRRVPIRGVSDELDDLAVNITACWIASRC